MNYEVEAIPNFKKEAKQLIKKFRSLKQELANLARVLEEIRGAIQILIS